MKVKQPRHQPASGGPRRKPKKITSRADDAWRLPSGKRLAEFALDSGFLVPSLMKEYQPRGRRERGVL